MLDQTQEYDPLDAASNPPERTYDLFGKLEVNAWPCAFQKGTRGGVPYDPAVHKQRFTMVDMYIQPLAEIDVKYPKSLELHEPAEFATWAKIVWPSIKALGISNLREIKDRWVRVAKVPDGNSYQRKDPSGNLMFNQDGSPVMVETTTFKFVQLFADENECRAAYLAAGGTSNANGNGQKPAEPVASGNAEKDTAYQFLKVIVANAVRGLTDWQQAKDAVALALNQYPTVSKFFNADSVETGQLMSEANDKLLPF